MKKSKPKKPIKLGAVHQGRDQHPGWTNIPGGRKREVTEWQ
jgi:hypothetical protein